MCVIRALRDCKQRSLTVSKKAPTVSKKLPPIHTYIFIYTYTLSQEEGILLQKYRDGDGSYIATLFKTVGSGVDLRGPATILFLSRDAYSDSIA